MERRETHTDYYYCYYYYCYYYYYYLIHVGTNIYTLVSPYMTLTNIYYGLSSSPTILKMCPPLTTKNWHFYKPLVAVGNGTGGVQIVNLSTRQLYREITVHTCAVRY